MEIADHDTINHVQENSLVFQNPQADEIILDHDEGGIGDHNNLFSLGVPVVDPVRERMVIVTYRKCLEVFRKNQRKLLMG